MPDLEFKLKLSNQYLFLMLGFFSAGILIVLCLSLSLWLKGIGILLIIAYGFSVIWKFGLLRSRHSIMALRRHENGHWRLHRLENECTAVLRGDSTITGIMSILRFQVPDYYWPQTCIIFRDSLGPDVYRQLLVVLKMG